MKHHHNSWKRTGGLAALALVGLLAGPAARAELMNFETSLITIQQNVGWVSAVPAAYQPIPYVNVTYSDAAPYDGFWYGTAYQYDHTTTAYGGTHCFPYQVNYSSGTPMSFTFDQPVSIPSFFVSMWHGPTNNVARIRACSDAAGTVEIYNSTFTVAYPWTGWTTITNLASLGTNIMRLEVGRANGLSGSTAFVDDITIYGPTYGTVQGIQFQLPSDTLQPGMTRQPVVLAKYALVTNNVTTWATFISSDPTVATVSVQGGVVTAAGPGTANIIASFGGFSATNTVTVGQLPAATALVTFNNAAVSQPAGTTLQISAIWNAVAGITNTWGNVGLFNGGPDHSGGFLGYNNWAACQYFVEDGPQVYTFTYPVGLPSLWLTTSAGTGDGNNVVTINAYSDIAGTALLGTVTVNTPTHGGAGFFNWVECTSLNNATYNGKIMNVQISAPGNAMVDDMVVAPNYGTLTNLTVSIATTTLEPGMSRYLTVTGNYTSNNIGVRPSALYSSSNPSVATVAPDGRVQALAGGSATITASLQTFTNTVNVTVSALPANAKMVNFNDGGWMPNMYNYAPIATSGYEPVPDLYITYPYAGGNLGTQLYDGAPYNTVVDHTTAMYGSALQNYNNYCGFAADGAFIFNRPVGIPSVWLATGSGYLSGTRTNMVVIVRAYSDVAGNTQIYSNICDTTTTPLANYSWTKFTGLNDVGNTIRRVRFSNANTATYDDITIVAPALGSLQALHLTVPNTSPAPNSTQTATCSADYAGQAGVDVSVGCGTVYSSSNTNVLTVTSSGAIRAIVPGTVTVSATLSNVTSSVSVTILGPKLQYSLSGDRTTLTSIWPTNILSGYILEASPALGPIAVWTQVSGTPTVVGANYQLSVTVNPGVAAAFFRLHRQ